MDLMVLENDTTALGKWVRSNEPVLRCYAAEGLRQLARNGVQLGSSLREHMELQYRSIELVRTCHGCTDFRVVPMREALNDPRLSAIR